MGQISEIHPFKVGQVVIFHTASGGDWRKNVTTGKGYLVLETTTSAYVDRGHRFGGRDAPEITTYSHSVRICNDVGVVEFYGAPHFTISLYEYLRSQPKNDIRLRRWGLLMRATLGLAMPVVGLYQAIVSKLARPNIA